MKNKQNPLSSEPDLLGHYVINHQKFPNIDNIFSDFRLKGFKTLTLPQRNEKVNRILLTLIRQSPSESFLLPAIIDYISKINKDRILINYSFINFEFWLNQYSNLNNEENYNIRSKIVGKHIPREDYQVFFPVGMGKVHKGTHFVTAHNSPDLDTTIASFWGWVDAFAARLGNGLHIWNLPPGGAPTTHNAHSFYELFNQNIFSNISQSRTSLSLTSMHFISQKSLIKKHPHDPITGVDHERYQKAIIVIDEQGRYLGDWKSADVEGVRQVQVSLNTILRWIENNLHANLIALFAQKELTYDSIPAFINSTFDLKIKDCEPNKEFTEIQKQQLHDYLSKVLEIKEGSECSFGNFCEAMTHLSLTEFLHFRRVLEKSLKKGSLFDSSGHLFENRPRIFNSFNEIVKTLDAAIQRMRSFIETMEIALLIKERVLQYPTKFVTLHADIEEILEKMGSHNHLTVIQVDENKRLWPLGVIHAKNLRHLPLGTVTLRDFCNREEVKIASYLDIISVVDHHRTHLATSSAPQALIGDAQSCNVLVAEQSFIINDKYSSGGMAKATIDQHLKSLNKDTLAQYELRSKHRLFQRKIAIENTTAHYIHPDREFAEYLQFLYAILEDTDLLSKVSGRDVYCVASLLNRLKSLMLKKDAEIIHLEDIPKDDQFASKAARYMLQNEDLFSLYGKIYKLKEKHIELALKECAEDKPSDVFSDTKEQNGCCRVSQTKLFAKNYNTFRENARKISAQWLKRAQEAFRSDREIDLHIHMISTIPGAEEVYNDDVRKYYHKDEMWIWTPLDRQASDHLTSFLNAFKSAPEIVNNHLEVEFLGTHSKESAALFTNHFLDIPQKAFPNALKGVRMVVLKFDAGSINSRKAVITPYLPVLVK